MHFVKWLRKNNQKIMVWVVVIIMITFVGGFSFRQLLAGSGPSKRAIATINGEKISALDRMEAISEIEVLKDMGAGQMLMSQRNITGPLLTQLLFPDSGSASMLEAQIKYAAMQGNFAIDEKIVQSFFDANKGDAPIYWILLNKEAEALGFAVDTEKAMEIYKNVALGLTRGAGNAGTLVANLSMQHKMPQEQIIEIFARMLSVTSYVDSVTKTDSATLPEIQAQIGYSTQKINASYIEFAATHFIDGVAEVDENVLSEQFDAYKSYFAGNVTEANPFGFGYKIPSRVQFEYVIIKLEDVEKLIKQPTEEETENYYTRNKSQFTEETKTDPTNPDSETTTRIKAYSEVMSQIKTELADQRTNARAEMIMNEIKTAVGKDLLDKDTEKMTGEQIKQFAGDYTAAAVAVAEKAGIPIYSGKTGYLSREDLRSDRNLGRLSEQRPMRMPVELTTKAFAVEGLGEAAMSKFDGAAPKIYENIGPMMGIYPKTLALLRVTDFKAAEVPADINVIRDVTKSSIIGETAAETYTIKDKVTDDCKLKAAMAVAKEAAAKFITTAGDDWDLAKEAYNKEGPESLWINDMKDRNRISDLELQKAQIMAGSSGMGLSRLQYTVNNKMLLDGLYSMKDSQMPATFEFPAGKSVLAVKEISVINPTTEDYETAKKDAAAQMEGLAAVKAAFIRLNADNILARSGFEYAKDDEMVEAEE